MISNYVNIAKKVMGIEISALELGMSKLGTGFEKLINSIDVSDKSAKIILTGMGKSGHIAKKIAATLASTGTPSFFMHPAEAMHGDLGMITEKDTVIAISQSGKTDEILNLLPYIKRNNIKLIAMTGDINSYLANNSQFVIDTAVNIEACPLGLAPTASTTLALSLGDALAICLLTKKGFTEEDFALTHPHGSLGRKLLSKVCDVMLTQESFPLIPDNTVIKDVLCSMSMNGMGIAVLKSKHNLVTGIFTDGDLRRTIESNINLSETTIDKVMTKEFKSIKPDKMAVEAASLMEKFKIYSIPVMNDENHFKGIISIKQLLQLGVI